MPTPASYDLHLHTYWSYDATAQPESHFRRATELGLRCIAITEHHVLDSQPDVMAASARYPQLTVIPAAELTVHTSIGAVDLLCYGFPEERRQLQPVLDAYHSWQQATGEAMCAGLQALGHDYTNAQREALLRTYRPARTLAAQGLTHVKNQVQRSYFIERGFIADASEYGQLCARARQAAAAPDYPAVDVVVPAVKALGVVVAIAHPHGYFAAGDRQRMDALCAECHLDGVECAHQSVPAEFTPVYRAYCEDRGLLSMGGSDSHTDADVATRMATHGGPDEWLDGLLERIGDRRLN